MTKVVNKAKLLPEDWEKIILHSTFGKSTKEISEMIGVSDHAISRTVRVFNAVKGENWDEVCRIMAVNNVSINLIKWCSEKTGKEIPPGVQKTLDDTLNKWREQDAENKLRKATQEANQQQLQTANENLYRVKVLELLAKIIELLEQNMDVVIPKYCNDIKDNINANTDVTCERLKQVEMCLEKIAKNTRPRGM